MIHFKIFYWMVIMICCMLSLFCLPNVKGKRWFEWLIAILMCVTVIIICILQLISM